MSPQEPLRPLAAFCQKANCEVRHPASKGKRRDVVDAMRTVFWMNKVCEKLTLFLPYKLGRLFEPQAFTKNAVGRSQHTNKWRHYLTGRHVPSTELVDIVEQQAPGCRALFDHAFFEALRIRDPVGPRIASLIAPLDPAVRRNAHQSASSLRRERVPAVNQRQCEAIENHVSLDALACLLLLLREAAEQSRHDDAYVLAGRTGMLLMVLGQDFVRSGLLEPLADYFNEAIFPLATSKSGECLEFLEGRVSAAVNSLLQVEQHLNISPAGLTEFNKRRLKLNMLRGRYGTGHSLGLSPLVTEMDPDYACVRP